MRNAKLCLIILPMGRIVGGIVAVLVLYAIITNPTQAAGTTRNLAYGLASVGQQIVVFFSSVTTSLAGGTTTSGSTSPTGDKDCRDFPSQAAAQAYFTSIGGSATNNADDLDANHNGIACEDYNYATAGTAGSSTAGASGSTAGPSQVSVVPSGGVEAGDGSFPR